MDFVTKFWDYFYLWVSNEHALALDSRGIDLAYPAEFERRSGAIAQHLFYESKKTAC